MLPSRRSCNQWNWVARAIDHGSGLELIRFSASSLRRRYGIRGLSIPTIDTWTTWPTPAAAAPSSSRAVPSRSTSAGLDHRSLGTG